MIDFESDPEFKAMREEFTQSLAERRNLLGPVIRELSLGKPEHATLEKLQTIAHKLAGAAESYGYPTLTRISEHLDEAMDRKGLTSVQVTRFAQLLDESLASAASGRDPAHFMRDPRMVELISVSGLSPSESTSGSF